VVAQDQVFAFGSGVHGQRVRTIRGEWLAGATFAQIARKFGIDPRTAKRYAVNNLPLRELGRRDRSKLDPHRKRIEGWVWEESITVAEIQRRLVRSGCPCGYMTVRDYLTKLRKTRSESPRAGIHDSTPGERKRRRVAL